MCGCNNSWFIFLILILFCCGGCGNDCGIGYGSARNNDCGCGSARNNDCGCGCGC